MVTSHQMLATIVLVLLGALALSKIESFFLSSCIKYFCLDFVSIKSLPTKQTSPKTKIEVNSERKQAASHLFNTTVEEGKILDQQTSWRKITHRDITLHIKICYEFSPFFLSFFLSFSLFQIKCSLYLICSIKRRTNTEARDINKNIHGISVTQNNIVRRNSQENNINYNPYFVAEDDFQVLRSFHFSDVGHEGKNQYLKLIA